MYSILTDYNTYLVYLISAIVSFSILFLLLKQKHAFVVFIVAFFLALALPLPYAVCSMDSGHCAAPSFTPAFYVLYVVALQFPFLLPDTSSIIPFIVGYAAGVAIGLQCIKLSDERRRTFARAALFLAICGMLILAGIWLRVRAATPQDFIDAYIQKKDALTERMVTLEQNRDYSMSSEYRELALQAATILPVEHMRICGGTDIEKFDNNEVLPSSLVGNSDVRFGPTRAATCLNGYVALKGIHALDTCWNHVGADLTSCIATYAGMNDKTGAFCEAERLQAVGASGSYDDKLVIHVNQCREAFKTTFGSPAAGSKKPAGYDSRVAQSRTICGQSFVSRAQFGVLIETVDPTKKEITVQIDPHYSEIYQYDPIVPPRVFSKDCKELSLGGLSKNTPIDIYTSYNTPLTALVVQDTRDYVADAPSKPLRVAGANADYKVCGRSIRGQLIEDRLVEDLDQSPEEIRQRKSAVKYGGTKDGIAYYWFHSFSVTFQFGIPNNQGTVVLVDKNCNKLDIKSLAVDDTLDIYTEPMEKEWSSESFIDAQFAQKKN